MVLTISARTQELVDRQGRCFTDDIMPALSESGIRIVHWASIDPDDRERLADYFTAQIFPVLTPLAVDPAHPFPYISGLSLNMAIIVRDPETKAERFARVKVPNNVDRFVQVRRGINDFPLAQRMVDNLGSHYATFLRGHGVVVVGPGIEGTCISAIQLERACQDQLLMMSIGEVKPMADAGRGRSNARLENPYRAWPFLLWKHKIKSKAQIRAGIRTLKEGEHY